MIFESWRWHHNAHHAHPNQHEKDPDMEIPFIATTAEIHAAKSRIQHFCVKWQVYYYHSLGLIVSMSNRLGAVTYFLKPGHGRSMWKLALYLPAIVLLFPLPFLLFPLGKALFVFVTVHAASGLYLANCFAPNHKGMRQIEAGAETSFLEQQVVTSRNVRGGFVTNLVLMGLNYQTEHHLFPGCPRNKLKLLTPHVKAACREAGVPYTEVGFIETNRFLLQRLGEATRQRPAPAPATP
jgi:fatty acid desaturase